jgi:3-oxoacyl-[acyl-carrier protein] reductase
MDLGIKRKRAVVTGGSSGLGWACADALAAEGVDIVLFARDATRLGEARDRLVATHGVTVDVVAGDMTNPTAVALLRRHLEQSGGLDILVLNTPRPPSPMRAFLDEDEDERWEQAYERQLKGALLVLRQLGPLLAGRGWGRLVAITSASVKAPMPRHALSTIFRAGVQAALKHLSQELGPSGVTVNAVAPATLVTPTFSTFHDLEARIAATAVRRAGRPEELGALVAYLASQHAGFITGQVVQLDGGQTTSLV